MSQHAPKGIRYATNVQTSAVFVALISVGSYVSVPLPGSPVPIVLQNVFVVLTGIVLPFRWASATMIVYLTIGAVGLPVFAGATGGLSHFAGPTGGFLIGYLPAVTVAAIVSRGTRRGAVPAYPIRLASAIVAGFTIPYLTGVPWLAFAADLSYGQALLVGCLPFLPGDTLKAVVLFVVVRKLPNRIWRQSN